MDDPKPSHGEVSIRLSDRERAVVRDALAHHLEDLDADDPDRERLERHYRTAREDGTIGVAPGAAEVYRSVFREYARALQRTVDDEDVGSMADFYEEAFTSVLEKIRSAT